MKKSLISTAIKQAIAIDPAAEMRIKEISRKLYMESCLTLYVTYNRKPR